MKSVIACFILAGITFAQSSVDLKINTQNPGASIPADFNGISLEMGALKSGNGGTMGNMFDDTLHFPQVLHSQVLTLFKELGIKNIRVGGGSVDMDIVPSSNDIDAFFRFVKVAGVNVIYSVRLLNGNITDDTNTVKYIWSRYKQYIDCFSIGNEPDWNSYHNQDPDITNYPTYLDKWNKFAAAITTAEPEVKFGGPDTGSNYPVPGAKSTNYLGLSWTNFFAISEKNSGIIKGIYLHNYVGQGAQGKSSTQMIDAMLSAAWVNTYYPALYNTVCVPVKKTGFPFRLTESNSFSGYTAGGSNSFATALFSLDYMHWWAEHGAAGINFHNKQWVGNGPIYMDNNKFFQVYPVGYGIKAFDIGGHGKIDSVTITNPDTLNLTAYAVADTNALFVTVINKEHGSGKRDANVHIAAEGYPDSAAVIYLKSSNGVTDTDGVTLGGAAITNSGHWEGLWSAVDSVNSSGYFVKVPASSAAIVKISKTVSSVTNKSETPKNFRLEQNYPNPFNPSTVIRYQIPAAGHVKLKVYNLLGKVVANLVDRQEQTGSYDVSFNAGGLASGVYFYRLQLNGYSTTKKMILIK